MVEPERPAGAPRIRRVLERDAGTVRDLVVAAFAEYAGRLEPPSSAEGKSVDTVRAELALGTGFIAEVDGVAIGCVLCREDAGALYWDRLSVLPAHRGRGVAGTLVAAVEAEAVRLDLERTRLSVRLALADNHRLYERLGYRRVALGTHPGYDRPTYQVMEKVIGRAPLGSRRT